MSSDKVALVTGSGKRRVGWHVAEGLARRGYAIAVHYRSSAAEAAETVEHLRALGVRAEAFAGDLADERAVEELTAAVLARFGRLDVLVNTAAIWRPKDLEQITAADVLEYFSINTLGTFLCCQHVGLAMTKQPEGGAIVNVGDWATKRPYRHYAAYLASKGAIPTLTRTFAVELAARNPRVRVNCVLPGPVMLPADLPAGEREHVIAATLVQREGSPDNVAQAVLHFVENDFITGACLPVDGGRTVFAPEASAEG
jgi:pteridine reductase